jgi:hypothetical protein
LYLSSQPWWLTPTQSAALALLTSLTTANKIWQAEAVEAAAVAGTIEALL